MLGPQPSHGFRPRLGLIYDRSAAVERNGNGCVRRAQTKTRGRRDDGELDGLHLKEVQLHRGLRSEDRDHHLAQVDTYEPLAFVTLWAAKHGRLDEVPRFNGGGRYLWGCKLMYTGYGPFYHVVNTKGVADVTKDDGYIHQVLGTWSKKDRALLEATNISDVYKRELLERWYPE